MEFKEWVSQMYEKPSQEAYDLAEAAWNAAKTGVRTGPQNSALHLYCNMLADALNDAGWDMKRVLTKQADIPWTGSTVKENLWKPIQSAMLDKSSTTRLNKKQVSEVYEVLNRHTASKLGVGVPFPDRTGQ